MHAVTPSELDTIGIIDPTDLSLPLAIRADPTGTRDSTAAINQVLARGYAEDKVVILPPGVYLISDTIEAVRPQIGQRRMEIP